MFTECMPNVYCKDIQASLAFYRDLLGLRQTYQFPATGVPEHVEFKIGDSYIAISSPKGLESHHLPPATYGQSFELSLHAQDTDAVVAQLRATGVPVMVEPQFGPNGQRIAYVLDPDGNRIHLYSQP